MTKTWQVVSSNGELLVDMDGDVLSVDLYADGDTHLQQIVRFDMIEWETRYSQKIQPDDSIDILLLGYWYIDHRKGPQEIYEPPIEEYRKETESKIVIG